MVEAVGSDYIFVPTSVVSNYVGNLMQLDSKAKVKVSQISESDSDPVRKGFFGRIKNRSGTLAKGVLKRVIGQKGEDEIVKKHSKSEADRLLGIPEKTTITKEDVEMIERYD